MTGHAPHGDSKRPVCSLCGSRECGCALGRPPDGDTDTADVVAVSVAWEAETGCDSIPTIERVYDRAPSGAYVCIWPGCTFARHYSGSMWRHVHSAHGCNDLPPSEALDA